jgi:hypothetical protein
VSYDARQGLLVRCAFMNARNADDPGLDPANPNRVDAYYDFAGGAGQGGALQIAFRTLPLDPATTKSISLHTRWQAGGAGRADAQAIVPNGTWQETECWAGQDAQFAETYDSYPLVGAESLCVFAQAEFRPFPDPFPPAP